MDVDSTADPTRIVAESAAAGVTPPEVIVPEGTVLSGSGSRAAPADAPAGEAVKETPARGGEPAISVAIPVGTPVESVVVGGLKESLVRATQFELRLRELASEAELVKSNMHVSTYVSFLPSGCRNDLWAYCCYTGGLKSLLGALFGAPSGCSPQGSE